MSFFNNHTHSLADLKVKVMKLKPDDAQDIVDMIDEVVESIEAGNGRDTVTFYRDYVLVLAQINPGKLRSQKKSLWSQGLKRAMKRLYDHQFGHENLEKKEETEARKRIREISEQIDAAIEEMLFRDRKAA